MLKILPFPALLLFCTSLWAAGPEPASAAPEGPSI